MERETPQNQKIYPIVHQHLLEGWELLLITQHTLIAIVLDQAKYWWKSYMQYPWLQIETTVLAMHPKLTLSELLLYHHKTWSGLSFIQCYF